MRETQLTHRTQLLKLKEDCLKQLTEFSRQVTYGPEALLADIHESFRVWLEPAGRPRWYFEGQPDLEEQNRKLVARLYATLSHLYQLTPDEIREDFRGWLISELLNPYDHKPEGKTKEPSELS